MRNGQRPNQYILNIRCPQNCDRTTAHRTPVPQDTPVLGDVPGGVPQDARTPVPRTPKPSMNHPMNHPAVPRGARYC